MAIALVQTQASWNLIFVNKLQGVNCKYNTSKSIYLGRWPQSAQLFLPPPVDCAVLEVMCLSLFPHQTFFSFSKLVWNLFCFRDHSRAGALSYWFEQQIGANNKWKLQNVKVELCSGGIKCWESVKWGIKENSSQEQFWRRWWRVDCDYPTFPSGPLEPA